MANKDLPERAWVIAGMKVLAESGINAVKVERLAPLLGVSKAPFYWRFKDRNALLDAMIEYWRSDLTTALIDKVCHLPTPRQRVEAIVELSLDDKSDGISVAAIEAAIRAWAGQDPAIGKIASEVDTLRVEYLVKELSTMGAGQETALILAKSIYLGLIGLYSVRHYTPTLDCEKAYRDLVGSALDRADGLR